jgi:hypothetical protein
MTFHSATRTLALVLSVGFATVGCRSMAVAMDDPPAYDSNQPAVSVPSYNCAAQMRDAVVWGTLPSAFCAPSSVPYYWSRSAGAYPYYYGRAWRGPGWHSYRSYPPGRGYGGGWRGFGGGWRGGGGRGGRR